MKWVTLETDPVGGRMVDDHVPLVVDDSSWGHRGRAFANGYIQATIEAVKRNAK